MRYKVNKFYHEHFISTKNFYISFILSFLIFLLAIFVSQMVENQANKQFSNISENCAYTEKSKIENINSYIDENYKIYNELGIKKISSYYQTTDSIYGKTYWVNLNVCYLDFDSNFLNYKGYDFEINYISNNKKGAIVDESLISEYDINYGGHLVLRSKDKLTTYNVEIIGTYKSDKKVRKIFCSSDYLLQQINDGMYENDTFNIEFEYVFNDTIDKNFNKILNLYDNTLITRQRMVDYFLKQFDDIFIYFKRIALAFIITMFLSSLIVLYNYLENKNDNKIRNLFYESKITTIKKDLYKMLNSNIFCVLNFFVLYGIFSLIYYLIYKSPMIFSINSLYFIIPIVLDLLFIVIYDLFNVNNSLLRKDTI